MGNWKIQTNLLNGPSKITNHIYMYALDTHWQTTLSHGPPPPPHSLSVRGGNPITANDIVFIMPYP